jgi:hypothetical protein
MIQLISENQYKASTPVMAKTQKHPKVNHTNQMEAKAN